LTHQNAEKLEGLLARLVRELEKQKFVTDCISTPSNGDILVSPDTFMGVCVLPASVASSMSTAAPRLHRRLDIRVYQPEQFAFALLYFTGSDLFNRSMRLWTRKHGLTLSDQGLCNATHVGRERVAKSKSARCLTEHEIFAALKLEYVPPEQRETSGAWASDLIKDDLAADAAASAREAAGAAEAARLSPTFMEDTEPSMDAADPS